MNDCPCSYTACVAFVLPTSPSVMPYVEAMSAGVVLCVCGGGEGGGRWGDGEDEGAKE